MGLCGSHDLPPSPPVPLPPSTLPVVAGSQADGTSKFVQRSSLLKESQQQTQGPIAESLPQCVQGAVSNPLTQATTAAPSSLSSPSSSSSSASLRSSTIAAAAGVSSQCSSTSFSVSSSSSSVTWTTPISVPLTSASAPSTTILSDAVPIVAALASSSSSSSVATSSNIPIAVVPSSASLSSVSSVSLNSPSTSRHKSSTSQETSTPTRESVNTPRAESGDLSSPPFVPRTIPADMHAGEFLIREKWHCFEPLKYPGRYLRVASEKNYFLHAEDVRHKKALKKGLRFRAIPALYLSGGSLSQSVMNAVSLEGRKPEHFLVPRGLDIMAELEHGGGHWRKDASWKVVPGLCGQTDYFSFESVSKPGHFIRLGSSQIKGQLGRLFISKPDVYNKPSQNFINEVSFRSCRPNHTPASNEADTGEEEEEEEPQEVRMEKLRTQSLRRIATTPRGHCLRVDTNTFRMALEGYKETIQKLKAEREAAAAAATTTSTSSAATTTHEFATEPPAVTPTKERKSVSGDLAQDSSEEEFERKQARSAFPRLFLEDDDPDLQAVAVPEKKAVSLREWMRRRAYTEPRLRTERPERRRSVEDLLSKLSDVKQSIETARAQDDSATASGVVSTSERIPTDHGSHEHDEKAHTDETISVVPPDIGSSSAVQLSRAQPDQLIPTSTSNSNSESSAGISAGLHAQLPHAHTQGGQELKRWELEADDEAQEDSLLRTEQSVRSALSSTFNTTTGTTSFVNNTPALYDIPSEEPSFVQSEVEHFAKLSRASEQ